jgi:peroxiredoxin
MPEFTLKDTSGRDVSSREFQGKVLLVDFWATWCAPCKKEMPGYQDLYRRYGQRGFVVVGIAMDWDADSVKKFARKLGVTYPLLLNGANVQQQFGVLGLPTTLLVDRNRMIRKKVVGFEYTEVIENALKQIL